MAILDTLSVIFDADGSKLKKGAGEAEKTIEETKNKVVETDAAAQKLGDSFLDTLKSAQGAIAGLLGLGAITASVVAGAAATDALGKFSDSIGVNIEDVDAWGEATIRAGGTAEGFRGSLQSLTENLTELTLTGGGPAADTFARLGIQATDSGGKIKSAFDLLPEIAASFENLSKTEQVAFGQQLGLDQGTIQLLQQGKIAVDEQIKRQKELGVTTKEDAEIAAKFNDAMADMNQVFGGLTRNVGAFLLPAFTEILQGLESVIGFMRDNSDFIQAFFIGAAAALTAYYLPAIISAGVATLATIAPFVAMAAIVTAVGLAVGLLYDDIVNFSKGAPSLIGAVADWFVESFESISETVNEVWEGIKVFFGFITGAFVDGITGVFDFISSAITGYLDLIQGSINLVTKGAKFFGFGKEKGTTDTALEESTREASNTLKETDANPINAQTTTALHNTTASTNRNTSVSVSAVNVDARGGDSAEISAGIGSALRDEMQATVSNFDDGVAI